MTKEQVISYLKNPGELDESTLNGLRDLIGHYPFFPVLRMLYLKNLLNVNSYKFESELARQAIFIPDRKVLFTFLNKKNKDTTGAFELLPYDEEAFVAFFEPGKGDAKAEVPFDPPPSYQLADEVDTADKSDLIDRFITQNPTISPAGEENMKAVKDNGSEADRLDDGLITETLATIYVKQEMYDEAIRSYKKLSLKFPEKNSYFAGQIEKIKQLMSKKE
ncbi:MAG: hypothetical protein K9H26_16575 [Prolixibacteraceae bacterium]|nr:hypothetical protein [Prolixibacteraceae bacterium]